MRPKGTLELINTDLYGRNKYLQNVKNPKGIG